MTTAEDLAANIDAIHLPTIVAGACFSRLAENSEGQMAQSGSS
jgi:hypothetical protein